MPIFEYYCENCGDFELMLNLDELENKICCPNCQSEVQRVFSPPTFSRPFSGTRHQLFRKAEKGREPRVVRTGEGDPLEANLPISHGHDHHHSHKHSDPGYPPWMIKH